MTRNVGTTWGIVSTIRAPLPDILDFVAWHLDQGAAQFYLYIDDDVPETLSVLNAHPAIRARHTDAAWWAKRKGRPEKHQTRQSLNARHANNRRAEVDWLAHIDVDEFLLPETPIAAQLGALSDTALCARVRPIEALAPVDNTGATVFKAFLLDQQARQTASIACFPTWGAQLPGGFLSHVAGKLFFRTGLKGLQIRIHNVNLNDVTNPGQAALPGIELGHMHAKSWDDFLTAYRFRLARGSYRADLKPQSRVDGALNLHDLFVRIEATGGEAALRAFYDETCTANPALCARLQAYGLLRRHRLDLAARRARHFPGH
ncbi:glycosyltransferase family 2 protein [Puniceibacterium sp. IMCC21224]|uniref:glycosyltransferase family 2 protein n=1 Tax=Puniceibacterium sp. IMCC21224 TaxID=1618204 RepID=UPI00065D5FED|nr:glycosyltransferase family 2 protein [Puniceibacterium sp. IMCC21224]KMK67088.1 Glycosyl transferase family 2 [Puniceibacterium sp. IMCC21224]